MKIFYKMLMLIPLALLEALDLDLALLHFRLYNLYLPVVYGMQAFGFLMFNGAIAGRTMGWWK